MQQIDSLLKSTLTSFENKGLENAREEVLILFEAATGVTKKDRILKGITSVNDEASQRFLSFAEQRLNGRPLQYIIGEWDFCEYTFSVGEGVLIPRPETTMLVETADTFIAGRSSLKIIDLCAGSGCIGLTVALHNPGCEVYLVEKSDEAFTFLEKNKKRLNAENAHLFKGDIFGDIPVKESFDVLLSNPPYIASEEISSLQSEVLCEPAMALDGGADGLDFYRAICTKWTACLKSGALIAFECGEEQTQAIADLLSENFTQINKQNDFNDLPRMVSAVKR